MREDPEDEEVPTEVASDEDDDIRAMSVVDCVELFSPVRVNLHVRWHGHTPGSSLDLLTGWNFDHSGDRKAALDLI